MKRKLFLFTIILAGLSSCFYNDPDIYEVIPIPGEPAVAYLSTSIDTCTGNLLIDSVLEISFSVLVDSGEFYISYVDMGDLPLYDTDSVAGFFTVSPELADEIPGTDTLIFTVYYSSNTNSLGDKYGLEADHIQKKFPVEYPDGEEAGK